MLGRERRGPKREVVIMRGRDALHPLSFQRRRRNFFLLFVCLFFVSKQKADKHSQVRKLLPVLLPRRELDDPRGRHKPFDPREVARLGDDGPRS